MKRLIVFFSFVLLLLSSISVFAVPQIGHQFYGYAVAEDAPITAIVNGISFETTSDSDGMYGYTPNIFFVGAGSDEHEGGNVGDTITWYVDNIEIGTYPFAVAGYTKLNFDEAFGFDGEFDNPDAGCVEDTDCVDGYVCSDTGVCASDCSSNDNCVDGYVCDTNIDQCVIACSNDDDCDGYLCDTNTLMCTNVCTDDTECADDYGCDTDNGACLALCSDDSDCSEGYACSDEELCANDCSSDEDCANGYGCNTDLAQCLVECSDDSDCDGYECSTDDLCAASCTTNADCADGYSCSSSICQEDSDDEGSSSVSSGGGSDGGEDSDNDSSSYKIPCHYDWECEEWLACESDGTQTRLCQYTGTCSDQDSDDDKPELVQTCEYVPPIQAPQSTCSDGIQNQGERGVDCGGPCTACKVAEPVVQEPGFNWMYLVLAIIILLIIAGIIIAYYYKDGKLDKMLGKSKKVLPNKPGVVSTKTDLKPGAIPIKVNQPRPVVPGRAPVRSGPIGTPPRRPQYMPRIPPKTTYKVPLKKQ